MNLPDVDSVRWTHHCLLFEWASHLHAFEMACLQEQPAWQYMSYVEQLTSGLPRVLLVHGCGSEIVTAIE